MTSPSSRVNELTANLAVAKLPARDDEIAAAQAGSSRPQAARDQARWRLGQRTLTAPAAGYVSDIVRRVGDVAGPQAPVVSFLPDGALKLKIYVPEAGLAGAHARAEARRALRRLRGRASPPRSPISRASPSSPRR